MCLITSELRMRLVRHETGLSPPVKYNCFFHTLTLMMDPYIASQWGSYMYQYFLRKPIVTRDFPGVWVRTPCLSLWIRQYIKSLICDKALRILSGLAMLALREIDLVALLYLCCLFRINVCILRFYLAMALVGHWYVIGTLPGHTNWIFLYCIG